MRPVPVVFLLFALMLQLTKRKVRIFQGLDFQKIFRKAACHLKSLSFPRKSVGKNAKQLFMQA